MLKVKKGDIYVEKSKEKPICLAFIELMVSSHNIKASLLTDWVSMHNSPQKSTKIFLMVPNTIDTTSVANSIL